MVIDQMTPEYQYSLGPTIRQIVDFMREYGTTDLADIGGKGMEERLALFDIRPAIYDLADGFDICKSPLPKKYQTIISANTFEHIIDPVRAAENIIASLKIGGYVFISTLFVYPKHNYAEVIDTYRYTDTILSKLFEKLEEVKCWFEDEGHPPEAVRVTYIGRKR